VEAVNLSFRLHVFLCALLPQEQVPLKPILLAPFLTPNKKPALGGLVLFVISYAAFFSKDWKTFAHNLFSFMTSALAFLKLLRILCFFMSFIALPPK
jgi:hypothetical protein